MATTEDTTKVVVKKQEAPSRKDTLGKKDADETKLYALVWSIKVADKEIDLARRQNIQSVEVEEVSQGSDTCSITILDPDFLFIEDDIFEEETSIEVSFGFEHQTTRKVFKGYISAIDVDFPDSGIPSMRLFCLDGARMLFLNKKKRTFEGMNSAQVAQSIANEYGLKCVLQPGYTDWYEGSKGGRSSKTLSQSEETDIEYLESLAKKEYVPFMCKIRDGTLYYIKKDIVKEPVQSYTYKKYPWDIVSCGIQLTKEKKSKRGSLDDIGSSDKSDMSSKDDVTLDKNGRLFVGGKWVKTNAQTPEQQEALRQAYQDQQDKSRGG